MQTTSRHSILPVEPLQPWHHLVELYEHRIPFAIFVQLDDIPQEKRVRLRTRFFKNLLTIPIPAVTSRLERGLRQPLAPPLWKVGGSITVVKRRIAPITSVRLIPLGAGFEELDEKSISSRSPPLTRRKKFTDSDLRSTTLRWEEGTVPSSHLHSRPFDAIMLGGCLLSDENDIMH